MSPATVVHNQKLYSLSKCNINFFFQVTKDVAELRTLLASATRKRIQDILSLELKRMETEVCFACRALISNPNSALVCKVVSISVENVKVVVRRLSFWKESQIKIRNQL